MNERDWDIAHAIAFGRRWPKISQEEVLQVIKMRRLDSAFKLNELKRSNDKNYTEAEYEKRYEALMNKVSEGLAKLNKLGQTAKYSYISKFQPDLRGRMLYVHIRSADNYEEDISNFLW